MNHEAQISNLLYIYAEYMDQGKLDQAASLFAHAKVYTADGNEPLSQAGMLKLWEDYNIIYPCGTPRTKHLVTNPIIELNDDATKASCRSTYTVLQQTDNLPLQIIATGRYHDEFERVDGKWRFSSRDYRLLDYVGDLSQHLKLPVPV